MCYSLPNNKTGGILVIKLMLDRVGNYYENELNYNSTEISKIKFLLEAIISDFSKLILMLIIFYIAHVVTYFLISGAFILLLRTWSGGFHMKTYLQCFSFTTVFFIVTITSSLLITLIYPSAIAMLLFCLITIFWATPIPSKNRPKFSFKKITLFKFLSTILIIILIVLFLRTKENPYVRCTIWAATFYSIQLVVSKWRNKYA